MVCLGAKSTGLICAGLTIIAFIRDARWKSFITAWFMLVCASIAVYNTKDFNHIHVSAVSLTIHVLLCRWAARELNRVLHLDFYTSLVKSLH